MRSFSWKHGITELPGPKAQPHHLSGLTLAFVPIGSYENLPTGLNQHDPTRWLGLPFSVPAHFNAVPSGAGILTCFPSPTPFGLGLGSD